MKVAVVGATGMVGNVMLQVLSERNLPISELLLVASERSAGKTINWKGNPYTIITLDTALEAKPDVAIFSAGGDTSKEWAPKFAQVGTVVIDNSSAWRMDPTKKLVVPEINGNDITPDDKIIANPNCSTIQMVLVLAPLHKKYGIKRVVVSTYQSVTGTGVAAVKQLEDEAKGIDGEKAYPHQIHQNCLPHIDVFQDLDYTKEEWKMIRETQKILDDRTIAVTATAVRMPVMGGHSESINIEFEKDYNLDELKQVIADTEGVILQDNPAKNEYPMPIYAEGKDEVFVGRVRRDASQENSVNLWVVADNLRKGAATNTIQIAELMLKNGLIK